MAVLSRPVLVTLGFMIAAFGVSNGSVVTILMAIGGIIMALSMPDKAR